MYHVISGNHPYQLAKYFDCWRYIVLFSHSQPLPDVHPKKHDLLQANSFPTASWLPWRKEVGIPVSSFAAPSSSKCNTHSNAAPNDNWVKTYRVWLRASRPMEKEKKQESSRWIWKSTQFVFCSGRFKPTGPTIQLRFEGVRIGWYWQSHKFGPLTRTREEGCQGEKNQLHCTFGEDTTDVSKRLWSQWLEDAEPVETLKFSIDIWIRRLYRRPNFSQTKRPTGNLTGWLLQGGIYNWSYIIYFRYNLL